MIAYLLPILLTAIFSLDISKIDDNKVKNRVYKWIWLYITLLAALRYNIGTDYKFYSDIFRWNIKGEAKGLVGSAYYHLSRWIDLIGGDYTWIIIFSSVFLSYSVYRIFSTFLEGKNLFFALFIYLTCGMYFSSFNIFRQYIAISFFMLSINYYFKRKYIPMMIMLISTFLFHSATIIASILLLFYFILKKNNNIFIFLIVFYIASLPFIFIDIQQIITIFSDILPTKYSSYLNNETLFLNRNKLAVLKLVVPNITMILLIVKAKIITSLRGGKEVVLGMLFFVCLSNLFYGIVSLTRFSEMFFIFVPLSINLLVESYKLDSRGFLEDIKGKLPVFSRLKLTTILKVSFMLYFIVLTTVTIFYMNGNGVMPYQNIVTYFLDSNY